MSGPLVLSIRLASIVTVLLFIIGIPLAGWLAGSRWRYKFLIEALVALPIVLPPTVLGYYILVAISPDSFFGRWYLEIFGRTLPFTFQGLAFASVLYSLPFAVQPFLASFEAVDNKLDIGHQYSDDMGSCVHGEMIFAHMVPSQIGIYVSAIDPGVPLVISSKSENHFVFDL